MPDDRRCHGGFGALRSRAATRKAGVAALIWILTSFALNPRAAQFNPSHGHVVLGASSDLEHARALADHLRAPDAHSEFEPFPLADSSPFFEHGGDNCDDVRVLVIGASNLTTDHVAGTGAPFGATATMGLAPTMPSARAFLLTEQATQGLSPAVPDPPPRGA